LGKRWPGLPAQLLRPGGQHRHDTEEEGEYQHQQAEAVYSKMKVDAKARHPIPIHFADPNLCGAGVSADPDHRG